MRPVFFGAISWVVLKRMYGGARGSDGRLWTAWTWGHSFGSENASQSLPRLRRAWARDPAHDARQHARAWGAIRQAAYKDYRHETTASLRDADGCTTKQKFY